MDDKDHPCRDSDEALSLEIADLKKQLAYAEQYSRDYKSKAERLERAAEDDGYRSRMRSWVMIQTGFVAGMYFIICAANDFQGLNFSAHPSLVGAMIGVWAFGYGIGNATKWGKDD